MHFPFTSPCSDGLQPESPVFRNTGSAAQRARHAARDTAGPIHPGVHTTAEHDPGLQGERHKHDGQHPHQLRGIPLRCHRQAHVNPNDLWHCVYTASFHVYIRMFSHKCPHVLLST